MLSKRILVLVSLLLISFLLVGCGITTPPIVENQEPEITSTPVKTATEGTEYTYDVEATDPDGDSLTYFLTTKPDGMSIDSGTGVISWIPGATQIGGNLVIVKVSDGVLSATQGFTVTVTKRVPMKITVDSPTFTVGEPYWFAVNMTANDDSGKSVIAHFGVPTSEDNESIEGTLEIGVGSDVVFLVEGDVFQTEEFTMEDATANFRGTFTKAGTYSTTLEVRTSPGGTLLCRKKITITIVVEQAVVEQLIVTQNSGQNDTNRVEGHPYINWTIDGSCIDFEFVNPTDNGYAFDYRVDREVGTVTSWSNIIINPGGELAGEEIGPSYNIVNVSAGSTETRHVCVEEEVWVGLRLGPENDYFLDWIKFEVR
ncbi:hypothetical protein ES695_16755 [Candidatus Atribacteria bacterium 1244-E10-H5-B2]|nr:MAG: hypothetical protein ES695_16755 [Candidatus Atribacteria bacterium 1244-E10-H5-B2]